MTPWTHAGRPVSSRGTFRPFEPIPRAPGAVDIHALDLAERRAKGRKASS